MSPETPFTDPAGPREGTPATVRGLDALVPLVYDELRRIAKRQLRRVGGRDGVGLLSTGDLVNEAYLKLHAASPTTWVSEAHFYGVAAHAMRQILVDHARRAQAAKRGGGVQRTTLSARHGAYEIDLDELIALDEALDRLDEVDTRLRRIVEWLFFSGMTQRQVAELLGVSTRTVEREWRKAKLFLHRLLRPDASTSVDAR